MANRDKEVDVQLKEIRNELSEVKGAVATYMAMISGRLANNSL